MGHFWYSVQQFESGIPPLDGRCAFTVARHLSDDATVGDEAATHVAGGQKTHGGATLVVVLRALLAGRVGDLTGGETATDG